MSGRMYLGAGAVLAIGGYLLGETLTAAGGQALFYGVLVLGAGLFGYGLYQSLTSRSVPDGDDLAHKVLLETLARMAYADMNTQKAEVETIRKAYKAATGNDIEESAIRVAARADIYEEGPYKKYVASLQHKLNDDEKRQIMTALAMVVRADGSVSPNEVGFFNEVGEAMKIAPSDLSDLVAEIESGA